jgi:hypothetical protein
VFFKPREEDARINYVPVMMPGRNQTPEKPTIAKRECFAPPPRKPMEAQATHAGLSARLP